MEILHPTYKIMLDMMLESYPKNKKLSIIDYGCGNGYLLSLIPSNRISSYTGFDVNESSIQLAKKRFKKFKNVEFYQITKGSVPKLSKKKNIDVVILIGVMQYMTDVEIESLIIESSKILNKNGVFLSSCVVDHKIYMSINLYGIFLPNRFINRKWISRILEKNNFELTTLKERSIIIGPLFSNVFVFFFDAIDKVFLRTKGRLGWWGRSARRLAMPLMMYETNLPVDYGYTLYIKASKK